WKRGLPVSSSGYNPQATLEVAAQSETADETHFSTEQPKTEQNPRVSYPNAHDRRTECPEASAREGPKADFGLTPWYLPDPARLASSFSTRTASSPRLRASA